MEKRSHQNYFFKNFFNIKNKIKYMIHITTVKSVSELFSNLNTRTDWWIFPMTGNSGEPFSRLRLKD